MLSQGLLQILSGSVGVKEQLRGITVALEMASVTSGNSNDANWILVAFLLKARSNGIPAPFVGRFGLTPSNDLLSATLCTSAVPDAGGGNVDAMLASSGFSL